MSVSRANPNERSSVQGFEQDTREVLSGLRTAILELFGSVPGAVRRPVDVQRLFGIDNRTSWRLFKLASATDPLAAGSHVPGRASVERALATAAKLRVPASTLEAVRRELDTFERLVERYAGDRTTFDTMVSAFGDEDVGQIDLSHRRAAFRANSHIFGVQSRAQMVTHVYFPNVDSPDLVDVVVVQGSYGLCHLRRQVSWPLAMMNAVHDQGDGTGGEPRSLSPVDADQIGLITEFSDHPPSQLRVREGGAGKLRIDLLGDAIGIPSSSTCLFAHHMRAVAPWYRTELDQEAAIRVGVVTPTEQLFVNVLLDTRTFGEPQLQTLVAAGDYVDPINAPSRQPVIFLPNRDHATLIGSGLNALHTPDLPRYGDLIEHSLARIGLDPERFSVYRLRIEYPVVPSTVAIDFPLPTR